MNLEGFEKVCLYVDHKNSEWKNPMDFAQLDFVSAKEIFSDFISFVEETSKNLFMIPKEKIDEFFNQITPPVAEILPILLKQMFEDDLIKKEEYEKGKADLEQRVKEMKKQRRGYMAFWKI